MPNATTREAGIIGRLAAVTSRSRRTRKSLGVWIATLTGTSEFWVLPYPSGTPKRAFTFEDGLYPFQWMPDGRRILFAGVFPGTIGSDIHIARCLVRPVLSFDEHDPGCAQPCNFAGCEEDRVHGRRTRFRCDAFLRFDLKLTPIIGSSRNESSPAWSPVGSQLAFTSDQDG